MHLVRSVLSPSFAPAAWEARVELAPWAAKAKRVAPSGGSCSPLGAWRAFPPFCADSVAAALAIWSTSFAAAFKVEPAGKWLSDKFPGGQLRRAVH